jgi:glycosyltransferase involved in cell wall biosynthesis
VTTLAFVIPTWNRPEHLKRCVESIATQLHGDSYISIVQDGLLAETSTAIDEMMDKWPSTHFVVTHNEHTDYSAAFRAMFRAEPDADWVWTFGDDDILRPGAVKFILERLKDEPADFIHVAEAKRASGTNNLYRSNTLLNLVNQFGLIEMTGFITGNITRGPLLAQAAETSNWERYAKTAFVQSLAILETLRDRPAMFMDIPLIDSQERDQTEQTVKVWTEQDIPGRYLLVIDAIEYMFDRGILTDKVRPEFFRYLSYHLFDRHLTSFIADYLNYGAMWTNEAWGKLMKFANFIADEEYANKLRTDIEAARGMTTLGFYMTHNLEGLRAELDALLKRRHEEVYPYSFMAKPKPGQ